MDKKKTTLPIQQNVSKRQSDMISENKMLSQHTVKNAEPPAIKEDSHKDAKKKVNLESQGSIQTTQKQQV